MLTAQKESLTPGGGILQNNRPSGPSAGSTALSAPIGLDVPHAGPAPRHLIPIFRVSDTDAASHRVRENQYSNRCQSPIRAERQILMSAQTRVNQILWIELCSNATLFVVCGAGVVKVEECFRLLFRRPKHPERWIHVECAGVDGFLLAPRSQ